jgi:hypothetical protein
VLAGGVLLAAVALVVATRVPPSSESRPLRVNLLHVQDRESGQAWWAIDDQLGAGVGEGSGLQDLLRAGGFSGETAQLLPWTLRALPVAPAMPTADRPVVNVLSDARVEGEHVVVLTLRSSDRGARVSLYVPLDARLCRIDVAETPYALGELPVEGGYQRFHCVGAACDGLRLDLRLDSDAPLALIATEVVSGLPEGGRALTAARPASAAPSGGGDSTVIIDRVVLGAP